MSGEVQLSCCNFNETLLYFTNKLKFKVELIYPADNPIIASLIGYNLQFKLIFNHLRDSTVINIYTLHFEEFLFLNDPQIPNNETSNNETNNNEGRITKIANGYQLEAPNGTVINILLPETFELPELKESLIISHFNNSKNNNDSNEESNWHIGRAGMKYRDLIPDRFGGRYIASHIHITEAGPVSDYVHYHQVKFQMIFCYHGRVKVVYEDQGEPFFLESGDCVIQPPEIRHRVLESEGQLDVIEIGTPAIHKTIADFILTLPNEIYNPNRTWNGQKFLRFINQSNDWKEISNERVWQWKLNENKRENNDGNNGTKWIGKNTEIDIATKELADVLIIKPNPNHSENNENEFYFHQCDLFFIFVLIGSVELRIKDLNNGDEVNIYLLNEASSVTIPSNTLFQIHSLNDLTGDVELLRVCIR